MNERESSRDIDAAAAAWVAREDRGPLSEDDKQALETWLAGDARRQGALLRARAMFMRSGAIKALGDEAPAKVFRPAVPRRQILTWGGGAIAAVAVGTVGGATLIAPDAYATERGEIRLTPLADGSTMMLNTATRVKVKYDAARRFVRVVEGEAFFTVLPDAKRPFVVQVGDERFSTNAGAFRVRRLKDTPIDVLVQHGRLDLDRPNGQGLRPTVLNSNTRMIVADGAGAVAASFQPVSVDVAARELAWREGMIAFEGETLAQAAAAFARYSDTRIVIRDPALAGRTVTGLFAANDPAGFGQAVAGVFGASAELRDGEVVLSPTPSAQ